MKLFYTKDEAEDWFDRNGEIYGVWFDFANKKGHAIRFLNFEVAYEWLKAEPYCVNHRMLTDDEMAQAYIDKGE